MSTRNPDQQLPGFTPGAMSQHYKKLTLKQRHVYHDGQDLAVPVIAIDGGAGVGKTTTERALAKFLGWNSLDTGVLYRAVALLTMRQGIDLYDIQSILDLIPGMNIKTEPDTGDVLLNDRPSTIELRSIEVGAEASKVSKIIQVRKALLGFQFQSRVAPGLVVNGRDARNLFNTPYGYFLVASVDERVKRAQSFAESTGTRFDEEGVRNAITERDKRDRESSVAPLIKNPYSLLIDTSGKQVSDVVRIIFDDFCSKGGKAPSMA